ncbi:Predicted transcriptional regulator, contains HTH domain [Natronoarchaeum philippinense]|uniref:Predicted transcriptional regulator, contains HTH domain n=1 Tax=Natronoarchaeum philippinense TaxID=558529 RepID=A0A285NA53_NATPI|nr:transcriptional regulator FilR1 domain-containing protein [Natronoarchaeum philippinense]SNZ05783.1 Predicted transcriptional regulator, contains HTH domain [Natronoarchaeum philippinense]
MESALEEIEFLALSSNRVEVLGHLASGRHTRTELADATGASQATLGRILGDFEDRSWVRREEGQYVATATGRLVAEGFTDLLDILETESELRDIVRYLPTHAMDFDLQHLADATITVPSQTRPNAPVQRLLDLERSADEIRAFSHAFNEQSLAVIEDRVTAGEQTFRVVLSQSAVDALAGSADLRQRLASLLDADDAAVRVREDGIPLAVTIADDVVHLLLRDENGVLQASVDTDDAAVRSWAHDTFDHYWRAATPLSVEEFEE